MLAEDLADLLGKALVTGRQRQIAALFRLQAIRFLRLSPWFAHRVKSCDGPCLHSRDDVDLSTDRKTKLPVRAPLIDGDFGKPV
jgi:hypothetical protein